MVLLLLVAVLAAIIVPVTLGVHQEQKTITLETFSVSSVDGLYYYCKNGEYTRLPSHYTLRASANEKSVFTVETTKPARQSMFYFSITVKEYTLYLPSLEGCR